ncbi:4-aminobutyrate aminotransferase [Kribbella amoyensis]|uniref:alanine--glyoxylate transaminase n=1 Tax=Kribbella amoyensis TaxID=996641 RepID=A0A561B0W7_9ACTN|nr:aspartate aminotransferase family protein [Kribbella amoyensis]TWD72497.1 4-aminobutyrate aminotransferase [Kribbella amoyensis]
MTHAELWERHQAVMPEWLALYYEEPIEIVSGSGRRVTDGEGNSYLDFFAGILTNAIGYDIAEIAEAVREQLASGVVHTSTVYLIRRQIELAEKIAELSGIPSAKVFFTNSGTEANEAALLFATQNRRSNQVLAMRNSYHGRSFGTIAITGHRGWSASSLTPVNVQYVQGAYRYRSPFRDLPDAEYIKVCVDDLRQVIDTTTSGDVACLIAEPIQGVGGFSSGPDGLYAAFKEVLDEYGILFISDEVQTGWGRTGEHFWGIQAHGVVPDAMTFAKGLGNGFAIGGVVASADLMDSLSANSLSTFGGNPLSTTAAKATIEYLLDNDLQANAVKRGAQLADGLRGISDEFPELGDVRGKGLMLAAEIIKPEDRTPDPATTAKLQQETKNRGLLIGKGGLHGNVLRMAPPMTLTEEEATEALDIIRDSFDTLR